MFLERCNILFFAMAYQGDLKRIISRSNGHLWILTINIHRFVDLPLRKAEKVQPLGRGIFEKY